MYDSTGKEMFSDYVQQFVSIEPMSLTILLQTVMNKNIVFDSLNSV